MGNSLEQYRQQIGVYNSKHLKQKGAKMSKYQENNNLRKMKIMMVAYLCIYISVILWPNISSSATMPMVSSTVPTTLMQTTLSTPLYQPFLLLCVKTVENLVNHPLGLSGHCVNETNKLCHTLYGNRRNIGYTYLAWNCDKGFLSQKKLEDVKIAAEKHRPHAIGVSEVNFKHDEHNTNENSNTHLSTEQLHKRLKIPGYDLILPASWERYNTARVIVKDDLKVKVKQPDRNTDHLQSILLELGYGKCKPHLFNFYYREWTSWVRGNNLHQEEDLDHLLDTWRTATDTNLDFVAMGDMNLCAKLMEEPGYQHQRLASKVKDFLLEENCSQIIDDYTRIRNVNGAIQRSCLDHVTINCVNKISTPKIIGMGRSDHLGIVVTKSSKEIRSNPRSIKKRIYKNFDEEAFRNDILKAKNDGLFEPIFDAENEDAACDIFEKVYTAILSKHAPLKVLHNRNNYVPYLNKDIKDLMKLCDELKEEAADTGDVEVYERYKEKRNLVTSKLRQAEANHHKSKFEKNDLSSADIWKGAKQILGSVKSNFPTQILAGGKLLSNPLQMASAVNRYFLDKISELKNLNDNLQSGDDATIELEKFLSDKNIPEEGFELLEVTQEEVSKLVKKIKGKKSCGLDWICGYSLKLVAQDLLPELTEMINLTIRNGSFTSQWKNAKILPAWKNKGNRFDLKYYRPLSNLPEVSKLAERAVHDQLHKFLCSNNLIHPNHHGFIRNCSTSTALQQMVDTWLQSLDEGKMVAALFLDLSAGFDVINHELLLKKLEHYRFSRNTINWFRSYLMNRYQAVQVESALSPLLPVPYGVPQGSILGPLLFLLFINELPEVVKFKRNGDDQDIDPDAGIVIYADDNTPSTSDVDPEALQNKLQYEADTVVGWFEKNDMVVSSDKTKLLVVTTAANRAAKLTPTNISLNVTVCGEVKMETNSEKLLGLTINNQLNWKNHLYGDSENIGLVKELSKRIGMLRQLRKYVNDCTFRILLNGMFTSKLIYGITIYGGVWNLPGILNENPINSTSIRKEDMRKLQILQNSALRLLLRKPRETPVKNLLKESKQLSVHQLVAYHTATQTYKVFKNEEPRYHHDRLFGNITYEGTRSSTRVDFDLSLGRKSFFYQASHIWNCIPQQIKTARTIEQFKRVLKPWITSNIMEKP